MSHVYITHLVPINEGEHGRVAKKQIERHRAALRRRLVLRVRQVHQRRDHPALDEIVQTDAEPYQVTERLCAAFGFGGKHSFNPGAQEGCYDVLSRDGWVDGWHHVAVLRALHVCLIGENPTCSVPAL